MYIQDLGGTTHFLLIQHKWASLVAFTVENDIKFSAKLEA
jgi:hypothetical protein